MLKLSIQQSNWNPHFFEQGGLFDLFCPWADWILRHREAFPALEDLNDLLARQPVERIVSGGGFALKFVRQQRLGRAERRQLGWLADYQMRIFLSGEVPSRPNNWHDFFNAWSWIHFPKSKAALNLRHFICADEIYGFPWRRSAGNRSKEQDFLTLFDEGGLVVVCEDDDLWNLIVDRKWKQLFVDSRHLLGDKVGFLPFGHALFECGLARNPRIHASSVRIKANPKDLRAKKSLPSKEALAWIDEQLALLLSHRATHSASEHLAALPIWGIPGWDNRSEDPAFISDTSYFR